MFWFRPDALKRLGSLRMANFDVERGLADGTLPHAIERIFCVLAKESGYSVDVC
jgi:lipopolysaccharide biosynthesis protein